MIAFLALSLGGAVDQASAAKLIVWIFAIQSLMVLASLGSFYVNKAVSHSLYNNKKDFNWEQPLTNLVWLTSIVSIVVAFVASKFLLAGLHRRHRRGRSESLVGAGRHHLLRHAGRAAHHGIHQNLRQHQVPAREGNRHRSGQGGASLNILSGFVTGNFCAFWMGLVIIALMFGAYLFSQNPALLALMPDQFKFAAPIFAFGLVAFGFLAMAPVIIAVDSFGPVTDNAQSIYELSRIESVPNVRAEIEKDFGFKPDFENSKLELEKGDGAGNTFKATAKPVLIGTAVVGATTMIFGIIMLLQNIGLQTDPNFDIIAMLSLVHPQVILGLLMGGAVIYWFTGASTQAVVTGAYRAVVYIKEHLNLDKAEASIADSKRVVEICTIYAQKGMINIFIVVFCMALALSFFDPYFFVGYLVGIAFFGLFQAIFMANAGGAWDNAKKIVEVDLKQKGTELHAATVVGDTVGDPFKDTSSVAMNPIIKFTTLFGLLAAEIAVTMKNQGLKTGIGVVFFLVALTFVYRSFYAMRIPVDKPSAEENGSKPHRRHGSKNWWRNNRHSDFSQARRKTRLFCFKGKPAPTATRRMTRMAPGVRRYKRSRQPPTPAYSSSTLRFMPITIKSCETAFMSST